MSDAAIEAVLRRDRVIVAAAVVVLTALAWAYVWWLAADMDMGGMDMCQAPWWFIQRHGGFRADARCALALGACHGAYCIGCCWALMALLFVGGVMNVLWIAAIAILVLAEKVVPAGRVISRTAGAGLFAGGAWLLAQALR
jgi:predicted metal-binding membrane protein